MPFPFFFPYNRKGGDTMKKKGFWDHKTGYWMGWTGKYWKAFYSEKAYDEWYQDHIGDN